MSNGKSPFEGQILEPLDNGFSYLVPPLYVQGFFLNHFLKARRICIIFGKLDLATTISLASQTFFFFTFNISETRRHLTLDLHILTKTKTHSPISCYEILGMPANLGVSKLFP